MTLSRHELPYSSAVWEDDEDLPEEQRTQRLLDKTEQRMIHGEVGLPAYDKTHHLILGVMVTLKKTEP